MNIKPRKRGKQNWGSVMSYEYITPPEYGAPLGTEFSYEYKFPSALIRIICVYPRPLSLFQLIILHRAIGTYEYQTPQTGYLKIPSVKIRDKSVISVELFKICDSSFSLRIIKFHKRLNAFENHKFCLTVRGSVGF